MSRPSLLACVLRAGPFVAATKAASRPPMPWAKAEGDAMGEEHVQNGGERHDPAVKMPAAAI
jgi:hypothetical protein